LSIGDVAREERARKRRNVQFPGIIYLNYPPKNKEKLFPNIDIVTRENGVEYVRMTDELEVRKESVIRGSDGDYGRGILEKTIHSYLDKEAKDQVMMFFGPSGSGKSYNVGTVLKLIWDESKDIPIPDSASPTKARTSTSPSRSPSARDGSPSSRDSKETDRDMKIEIDVLYGQAYIDAAGRLQVMHRQFTLDMTTDSGKQFGNYATGSILNQLEYQRRRGIFNDRDYAGYVTQVQTLLQTMKGEPHLTAIFDYFYGQKGVRLVKQNINNKQSSRCTTIYKVTYRDRHTDKYKTIRIVDAAGNESTYDILRGMYQNLPENPDEADKDKVLKDFLSATKRFDPKINSEYTPKISSTITEQKMELDRKKGFHQYDFDPSGFVPDPASPEYQPYAQQLVRESLYINIMIGEMAKCLTFTGNGDMKLLSSMLLIDKDSRVTLRSYDNDGLFADKVRFMYDVPSPPPADDIHIHDVHMELRKNENPITTSLFPLREYIWNGFSVEAMGELPRDPDGGTNISTDPLIEAVQKHNVLTNSDLRRLKVEPNDIPKKAFVKTKDRPYMYYQIAKKEAPQVSGFTVLPMYVASSENVSNTKSAAESLVKLMVGELEPDDVAFEWADEEREED
tara:strand:- start:175 stop:2040 length:1866 start_codon:yes stop_codon:yes gene_type:complete